MILLHQHDASLSIKTDLKSYDAKDLISISGVSDTSGTVNLSIENQNGELVWTEQVSLKSNGSYSTLAIAGGPGWEKSGTYSIKVDNGKETKINYFFIYSIILSNSFQCESTKSLNFSTLISSMYSR